MRRLNIFTCLLFLAVTLEATDIKYDTTVIDEMRNKLLRLERRLEKDLSNLRLRVIVDDDTLTYLWLIKQFKIFGDELDEKVPNDGREYLNALNPIWLWARTDNELKSIDGLYAIFRVMQKEINMENFNITKLVNFLDTILHVPNASIVRTLDRIGDIIVNEKLFIVANQEASSQICNDNQSLQQLLYNLYTTITLTEIKGYSMIQFSYKLLRLYNPDANFTEEMNLVKQQYEKRTTETLRAVKTAMAFAPRQIWKCDARINKLDETYTTLTQLFQGYIVNEVDLNNEVSCKENCAYYEYSKVRGCYKNQYCSKQRKCNGRILNCEYVDSDMWVCPSSENSDRRYEYIEYENGQVFGQKGSCKNGKTKVDSWWRWLFWHCSYCFCYCDDNNINSDRYFSLRKVVSDVANNKVVTGVRFKKVNKVIHIQIQEGELMPRGNINRTSVQWKPIEAFNILDKNVTADVDYHTLYWEKRGIDLDDITLDKNYLLTGLKFRMVGTRLNLEVRMTSFNFTTGKLIKPLERSFWTSHDQTAREELALPRPDIPTRSPLLSLPDSVSEQYLNFAPSDRKSDAAQNTIPFIDIQPIEPNPPVPIAGAGVYHKGRTGSGGYVALRLITYDFSQHLQVDLSPTVETVIDDLTEIEIV
ncbi:chemokine-like protein orion isoform X2 [Xylocopa sonorina]|uniref:chemokine-like protein orion isoform X2 n=1 Tax=Xylocopa sonorina TaxID=1818115 RepID=UPI00403B030B